jgi:hypothetical protein
MGLRSSPRREAMIEGMLLGTFVVGTLALMLFSGYEMFD